MSILTCIYIYYCSTSEIVGNASVVKSNGCTSEEITNEIELDDENMIVEELAEEPEEHEDMIVEELTEEHDEHEDMAVLEVETVKVSSLKLNS